MRPIAPNVLREGRSDSSGYQHTAVNGPVETIAVTRDEAGTAVRQMAERAKAKKEGQPQ